MEDRSEFDFLRPFEYNYLADKYKKDLIIHKISKRIGIISGDLLCISDEEADLINHANILLRESIDDHNRLVSHMFSNNKHNINKDDSYLMEVYGVIKLTYHKKEH